MWSLWGWVLLTALGLAGIPVAGLVTGRYGGGPVVVRDWLVTVGLAMTVAHLGAMSLVVVGAWGRAPGVARGLAVTMLAMAALTLVAFGALPFVVGQGPFVHGGFEVMAYTALVFAPLVLRSLGGAALAAGCALPWRWVVVGVFLVDAALAGWVWFAIRAEVVPRLHAFVDRPAFMVPWLLASLGLLGLLARSGRAPAPAP